MKKRFWQIRALPGNLMVGDRGWGSARLFIAVISSVVFMFILSLLFEHDIIVARVNIWKFYFPLLSFIPDLFLLMVAPFTIFECWRYLLIPLLANVAAILIGARYVQDIYEFKTFRPAWNYILACMFGMDYPSLIIEDGKKKIKDGELNLVNEIGGPGYIKIQQGNVVLFERLRGPSNVRAAGTHFVQRLERIKEIASLDDQESLIETIMVTTKDGIDVTIKQVRYRYRLRTGRRPGDYAVRSPVNPYPFSVHAVRQMAYERTVSAEGLISWHNMIESVIRGTIADYVSRRRFLELSSFQDPTQNAREELRAELNSKRVRERLRRFGAELLWFDIGHFVVPSKEVDDQRVATWGAKWAGNAFLTRYRAEAENAERIEEARTQAQAKLLEAIIAELGSATLKGSSRQNMQHIFLAQTARLIQSMKENEIFQKGSKSGEQDQ